VKSLTLLEQKVERSEIPMDIGTETNKAESKKGKRIKPRKFINIHFLPSGPNNLFEIFGINLKIIHNLRKLSFFKMEVVKP